MKHPVAQKDVLGRVDVALQLVIPAAIAVDLDVPRAAIERLEPCAVKVVSKEVGHQRWWWRRRR